MSAWKCGKPKNDGRPCRWHTPPCPHHPDVPKTAPRIAPVTADATAASERPVADDSLERAIEERDLHAVAWAVLGRAVAEGSPNASMAPALIRVLASLGPAPADEDEILKETELRGLVMSGLAPRDDEEWALAEKTFDDEAMDDLRSRDASLKRLK